MTSRHSPRRLAVRGSALALLGLIALAAPAHADDAAPAAAPAAAAAPAPAPIDPKTVVATINGDPITEADLELASQAFGEQIAKVPPEDRRRAVLDVLIDLRLMANAASANGLDKTEEFPAPARAAACPGAAQRVLPLGDRRQDHRRGGPQAL